MRIHSVQTVIKETPEIQNEFRIMQIQIDPVSISLRTEIVRMQNAVRVDLIIVTAITHPRVEIVQIRNVLRAASIIAVATTHPRVEIARMRNAARADLITVTECREIAVVLARVALIKIKMQTKEIQEIIVSRNRPIVPLLEQMHL